MAVRRRWKPMTGTALAAGVVLGGVLVYGQFGAKRPGGNPMNESRFPVHHVRLATDKPSSLFGQFGNAEITAVATMLDRKLEESVAEAIR
jgi:hypothetical protein